MGTGRQGQLGCLTSIRIESLKYGVLNLYFDMAVGFTLPRNLGLDPPIPCVRYVSDHSMMVYDRLKSRVYNFACANHHSRWWDTIVIFNM